MKLLQFDLYGALEVFEEALRIKQAVFGERNPSVATTLNNIGILALQSGNIEVARTCLQEAYEQFRAFFGDEHPYTHIALDALRTVLAQV